MSGVISRRGFLRSAAAATAAVIAAGCQPKVVEVTSVVERIVKETVIVEGDPQVVEKVVKETVIVEKAAPPVQAATKVALRCHVRGGADEAFHAERIPVFESQYPHIKIVLEAFPGSMYFPKILSMNATGTVGDVIFTNLAGGRMMQWSYLGVFLPLSSFIAVDDEFKVEDYFPAAMDAYTFEGVLHALPEKVASNAAILFYNKGMFDEAGLAYPNDDWTVDDLTEAGLKLVKDTTGDGRTDQWGLMKQVYPNTYVVDMRTFGGEYISKDGQECLIDTPESSAGMEWLRDLIVEHKIMPDHESAELADARNFFHGGKAAMVHDDMLSTAAIESLNRGAFEVGIERFPKGPTGARGNMVASTGLGISPKSRHASEAWEWIKFMANKETGVLRMTEVGGVGQVGARFDVYADERVQSDPAYKVYTKVVNELQPWHIPHNFKAAETMSLLGNTMPKMWIERAPADEVVAEVAEETRKILAMPRS